MASLDLDISRIYACLLYRANGEPRWLLAIPYGDRGSVIKFHAVKRDEMWSYERVNHRVRSSVCVCVAVEIGK